MLTAVSGYYDVLHIVISDSIALKKGQKVIITADISEPPVKKSVDLSKFMGRGEKMFAGNADELIKELRNS